MTDQVDAIDARLLAISVAYSEATGNKMMNRQQTKRFIDQLSVASLVVMPIEPSEVVFAAGAAAYESSPCMDLIGPLEHAYRAMIAAAGEQG